MCGHKDCFGALPGSQGRWFCFSANHGDSGVASAGGHSGDALDVDAHAAGVERLEYLRRQRTPTRVAAPTAPPPTAEPPTAGQKRHRLECVWAEDLMKMEIPRPEMLLDPWLFEGCLGMVFGASGMGKTYFTLSLAVAVAGGSAFMGWTADKPSPTLYIDGEMSLHSMQERIGALGGNCKGLRLGLLNRSLIDKHAAVCTIDDPVVRAEIDELVDRAAARLVVIDNLSSVAPGSDENDALSWAEVGPWLASMRHRNVAVLIVHHANKVGGQRGTSRRIDQLDVVLELKRPADYDEEQGCRLAVQFAKARHLDGSQARTVHARLERDDVSARWVLEDTSKRSIVEKLVKLGKPIREIARQTGMRESAVKARR